MDIQKVDFSGGGGDGITALYINGVLHKYGDYYHNKILHEIDGFIDGLKYALVESIIIKEVIFLNSYHPLVYDTWDCGNPPPKLLSDINIDDRRNPNEED